MTSTVPVVARPQGAALPAPTLAAVYRAALRSEWTKLRSLRSTIWSLCATVVILIGFGVLLTALVVGRWDNRSAEDIAHFDPVLYSLAGINFAQLSVGVLGVLVMTSEYASGGIRLTFAATPQRRLVLAAKVTTFTIVMAVISITSCVIAFTICQSLLSAKDADVSIGDPGVLRALVGGPGYLAFIGVIAVGLGATLRRTAAAIAALFAVLLVLPGLVLLLPSPWNDDVGMYLPSAAGESMASFNRLPNLLSPAAGLAVLCAYAAASLLIAAVTLVRRDA